MILVVVWGWLASAPPPSAAAEAEAEGFAALDDDRNCDAAAAFLRAYGLVADQRLLLNAGLAYERAGDTEAARETLSSIDDDGVAATAASRLGHLGAATVRCPRAPTKPTKPTKPTPTKPRAQQTEQQTAPDTAAEAGTASTGAAASTDASPTLFVVGCGGLIGGAALVVTAGAAAAAQGAVLFDANTTGDAKGAALAWNTPIVVMGVVGGVLIIGGALAALGSAP